MLALLALLFIGFVHLLHQRLSPLRRLARFRVPAAPGIRFHRLPYAALGDSPSTRTWYRYTLSFAIDSGSDWIYLRQSLLPFVPTFWRLPRKQIHLCQHPVWTLRISAADPPLHADFGPSFVAALMQSKR